MMQGRDFYHEATEADSEPLSPDEEDPPTTRKKKSKNKRRFTDDQVRSLETIFQSETKLEPRKKVQVAKELGLQPRQVAIWFQNKRARWKSKEIEKSYRILKSNYDNLKARLESLREDKESLLTQLKELRSVVGRSNEGRNGCGDFDVKSQDISEEHRNTDVLTQTLAGKSSSLEEEIHHSGLFYSDDDKSGNMGCLKQEPEFLDIDHSLISPVKWCCFDAGSLFDQPATSSHWWESWT